jgi:hypothetical protein
MRITFQPVKLTVSKSGICPVCGKRATRTRTESQTINPWNRNADGTLKTENEIRLELHHEIDVWEREPVYHQRCET